MSQDKIAFYSLAPRLRNEAGHDFIYHKCIKEALDQNGLTCTVLIDQDATIPNLPLGFQKHFITKSNRPLFSNKYQQLMKDQSSIEGEKVYFLDTFSLKELIDLILAFQRFSSSNDSLWLLLRYDFAQLRWNGRLHILLIKKLIKLLGARLVLLSDSMLIQKELETTLSFPISVLPIPHTHSLKMDTKPSTHLRCWWPGPPRAPKGWDIIHQILKYNAPQKISLSASSEAHFTSSTITTKPLHPVLSRDQYLNQFAEIDILLLPYDAIIYRCSTSGIFVEGIAAGKIPLVRDGSWLAYELRRFNLEELIVDWNDPLFWGNLIKISESKEIHKKLLAMQTEYTDNHTLNNFCSKITDILLMGQATTLLIF